MNTIGRWRISIAIVVALSIGIPLGLAVFVFDYGHGFSYLTNDPVACANCHIMRDQFNSWSYSSHREVAVCNDCHAPSDLFGKYLTKAINGWHHSVAFTMQNYQLPLEITPRNREITEKACKSCHPEVHDSIAFTQKERESIQCIRCHSSVGHSQNR